MEHATSVDQLRSKAALCMDPDRYKPLDRMPFLPRPSFLRGFGRMLDLGGLMDRYPLLVQPHEADALAIYSDWLTVGDDLWHAVISFKNNPKPVAK